jgi:hypothetical protein
MNTAKGETMWCGSEPCPEQSRSASSEPNVVWAKQEGRPQAAPLHQSIPQYVAGCRYFLVGFFVQVTVSLPTATCPNSSVNRAWKSIFPSLHLADAIARSFPPLR